MNRTPAKMYSKCNDYSESVPMTPINFSKELKQVLNERNLLTVKTRNKVCLMLDNINSSPDSRRNELDKRHKFRLQAIQEILTTEKTYLNQLETLMNYFIIPLKERAIINDAHHMTLFGQIEMIYNLNGELLNELEKDLENVGNAFLKIAPFFKLYSVYAFDYKNALLILQDLTNKNPVFRKFLENTETRPEVQTKLYSLMIVPIQRVPRYRLLLEQVLLYTSPADPDYKILKESVKQVELTVSHINSVMEDQEITQMLLNLQNSLVNRTPNIVKPSRKIIKEGILYKVTRNGTQVKRYCVLMSDIFMYCKMLKERTKNTLVENSLQCCCIFPLKKCKVYELFPGNFKITCQGDGVILCTPDLHMGKSWVTTMKDAIELYIQCRKTLRKESSKRTPMRKKEIKNFDMNDILSPNKKKNEYESVFRCKSTSDDDDDEKEYGKFSSCFSIKSKAHKRKHNETSGDISESSSSSSLSPDFVFKVPNTPPSLKRRPKSTLWSNKNSKKTIKKIESTQCKTTNKINTVSSSTGEETDPTYGFASRLSDSKTYFRTHNVDSTIPKLYRIPSNCENEKTEGMELNSINTLRPLQTSSRSSSSRSSENSWLHKRSYIDKENFFESSTQKKRVKFDDLNISTSPKKDLFNTYKFSPSTNLNLCSSSTDSSHSTGSSNEKPKVFEFSNDNDSSKSGISLLQRISNFFFKLF